MSTRRRATHWRHAAERALQWESPLVPDIPKRARAVGPLQALEDLVLWYGRVPDAPACDDRSPAGHSMTFPPAMSRVMPVIHDEADDARKKRGGGDVVGLTDPSEGKRLTEGPPLRFGYPRAHLVVFDGRGGDAVDPNAVVGVLAGQVAAESDHAGLGGGIGG